MAQTDFPREVNLTIPIVPNMEITATQTAEAVLQLMNFDNDQIDEVKHALIEGCINAFEHSSSREGNVYIKFVMNPDELLVVIQDFGSGFIADEVPEPVLQQKIGGDHKRGWGLMMMKSLMDSVDIASGTRGTQVTMTKKRPDRSTTGEAGGQA